MMMTRTIHPVGQGAFYTECFEDGDSCYNIVYDCGSETNFSGKGKLIDNEITQTFHKDEVIDALFISHFHNDHTNGVKKILNYCKVKYVFLPLINNLSKLLLITSNTNKAFQKFIIDPLKYIKEVSPETYVMFVEPYVSDNNGDFSAQEQMFDLYEKIPKEEKTTLQSGTKIIINVDSVEWYYIPYNLENIQLLKAIEMEFERRKKKIPDANNITDCEFKLVQEIFNTVLNRGDQRNANSMILYSSAISSSQWRCKTMYGNCFNCRYCAYFCHKLLTGCIYFGDFDLNIKGALAGIFHKYNCKKDCVSIIQVPHHGSKHNFNDSIFTLFPNLAVLFISAGEKNKYSHPSAKVVRSIIKSDCCLKLITENKSSMICFIYKKY